MSTPPRMVELECPNCQRTHWEIDNDFLRPGGAPRYEERTYHCPVCSVPRVGYRVIQKSPTEFFLQPDPMDPMSTKDFIHWLSIFRAEFPASRRLKRVGVSWYPGEAGDHQERKIDEARKIGFIQGYWLFLSNESPDDERILVCVQARGGQAQFWCGTGVDLEYCNFEIEEGEIEKIRKVLAASNSQICQAWQRFSTEARKAQALWLPKLFGDRTG